MTVAVLEQSTIRNNWTREEVLALFNQPFNDLFFNAQVEHRRHFNPNQVQLSTLLSIKTGACPEDFKYCPQSARYDTGLEKEKLLQIDQVIEAAPAAKASSSSSFCMGAALQLQAIASHKLPYQQVSPIAFDAAIAPHSAAQESGKTLSASRLAGFCRGLTLLPLDLIVIVGAGGWRVPLNDRETLADVARDLNCSVIIVVGMRLGCLNHALLTAEAIPADGLVVAG